MLDDLHVDVIRSNFDIAFRIGPMRDSSMVARKLAKKIRLQSLLLEI